MVMTAKVDKKKIFLVILAVAALILSGVLLLGDREETAATAAGMVSNNDQRVQFLKDFGGFSFLSETSTVIPSLPITTMASFSGPRIMIPSIKA